MPGIAASTSDTCEFGSPPNAVAAPENSFAFELTWAWTSSPMTTSQSPVAPLMRFEVEACTFMMVPWSQWGSRLARRGDGVKHHDEVDLAAQSTPAEAARRFSGRVAASFW